MGAKGGLELWVASCCSWTEGAEGPPSSRKALSVRVGLTPTLRAPILSFLNCCGHFRPWSLSLPGTSCQLLGNLGSENSRMFVIPCADLLPSG